MSEVRSRRAAREAAFQAAYQCACGGSSVSSAVDEALSRRSFAPDVAEFVRALAFGAVSQVAELDERYAPFLKSGWTPSRLALVDRLVLRLAVFELWSMPDVPPKVTISSAVDLAKRFGSAESGGFVNAVLGRVLEVSPKRGWAGGPEARRLEGSEDPEERDEPEEAPAELPETAWTLRSDD